MCHFYPTLSQMGPVHAISSCSCLTQFILTIPTTPKSSKQSVFCRFCNQNLYKFLFSPMNATAPPTITLITFHEKFEREVPHYAHFSMLLLITYDKGINVILSILFSTYSRPKFFPSCEKTSFTTI